MMNRLTAAGAAIISLAAVATAIATITG